MKTVFNVGQKVYDEVNFPGKEGVIIETNKNNKLNLVVKFDNVNYLYTLKGIYLGCKGTPTLSTKPYKIEFKGFEQKAPVITYKEIVLENQKQGVYIPTVELKLPNERIAEAFKALAELIWIRDYYNEGWKPNWREDNWKYVILAKVDINWEFIVDNKSRYYRVLHFKSREIAEKFLEEQKELLEIAKPLL